MNLMYLHIIFYLITTTIVIYKMPSKKTTLNGILFMISVNTLVLLITTVFTDRFLLTFISKLGLQVVAMVVIGLFYSSKHYLNYLLKYKQVEYYMILGQIGILLFASVTCILSYMVNNIIACRVLLILLYVLYIGVTHLALSLVEREQLKATAVDNRNRISEDMIPIIKQIRRLQHDYSNILSGLVTQQNIDEAYKSKVFHMKNVNQFESFGKVAPMIRTALYMKSKQLEEEGIEFLIYTWLDSIEIYTVNPKEYEIVTIIINLINNAAEALNKKVKENAGIIKKIIVKLSIDKGTIVIKVGNSGETIDAKQFDKWIEIGYTTKTEGYHGFGLHTIHMLCEKYHGSIRLEKDSDVDYIVVEL